MTPRYKNDNWQLLVLEALSFTTTGHFLENSEQLVQLHARGRILD